MQSDIRDFIGVFDDAVPETICEELIKHYHYVDQWALTDKRTFDRQEAEHINKTFKDDKTYFMHEEHLDDIKLINSWLAGTLNQGIRACIEEYNKKHDVLLNRGYGLWGHRLQRTGIGGGYHVWHYENSGKEDCDRILAIIIYLNDVEEGGETEFLYIPRRVKPKKGRVVIFPVGFTHTHRGNPPISNEKFIVATWTNNIN